MFNPSTDHTPPTVGVIWPLATTTVSGTNFTLRGTVDDPTSAIEIVTGSGLHFYGVPDDEGRYEIPVTVTNSESLTLIVVDYAGNARTNTLSVNVSSVLVSISTPSDSELTNRTITISGSVSVAPTVVTVNGWPATISGNTWAVSNFPTGTDEDTTMTMNVEATVPNGGGGATTVSTSRTVEKPPIIRLSLYTKDRNYQANSQGYYSWTQSIIESIRWTIDGGGFKTLLKKRSDKFNPNAAWTTDDERYEADWSPNGTSSWRQWNYHNGNLTAFISGTNVPLPGAFQVRDYTRT